MDSDIGQPLGSATRKSFTRVARDRSNISDRANSRQHGRLFRIPIMREGVKTVEKNHAKENDAKKCGNWTQRQACPAGTRFLTSPLTTFLAAGKMISDILPLTLFVTCASSIWGVPSFQTPRLSFSSASTVAALRLSSPSFSKMCCTCFFTVFSVVPRMAPISPFDFP